MPKKLSKKKSSKSIKGGKSSIKPKKGFIPAVGNALFGHVSDQIEYIKDQRERQKDMSFGERLGDQLKADFIDGRSGPSNLVKNVRKNKVVSQAGIPVVSDIAGMLGFGSKPPSYIDAFSGRLNQANSKANNNFAHDFALGFAVPYQAAYDSKLVSRSADVIKNAKIPVVSEIAGTVSGISKMLGLGQTGGRTSIANRPLTIKNVGLSGTMQQEPNLIGGSILPMLKPMYINGRRVYY